MIDIERSTKIIPPIDEQICEAICCVRMIALYMIVCVHCCSISEMPDSLENKMLGITACIGMIGVPLYFFCSGYLFDFTKFGSLKEMIKYKLNGLIVPWICSAVYMWMVENKLFHIEQTLLVEYFIGINSILWYLTVLIVFYIIFWIIRSKFFLMTMLSMSTFNHLDGDGLPSKSVGRK